MEPRGSIGDYNPTDDRYTIYTTLQRAHPLPRRARRTILKVPESRVRVVAGDIGGSFGMKSAVYNEVALVLLASKLLGRPVKWISTRSEAFLTDAQARDNVTEAELALDKDGQVPRPARQGRSRRSAPTCRPASNAFTGNLGTLAGVYRTPAIHVDVTAVFTNTNPMRPYRGNGRPEAAYVIERMVDLAADELGIDPAELRRKNNIPPEAMPFKTGLTFTYDCGEFEKNMDMALEARRCRRLREARARPRASAASCAASASPTPSSAPRPAGFEGAEIRFDRGGTVTLFSGSITQGQGHETIYKQIVCDRLGIDPGSGRTTSRATPTRCSSARAPAARARRRSAARRCHVATEKIIDQGEADRRPSASGRRCGREIRGRHVLQRQDQPHPDHPGGRRSRGRSRRSCRRTWSPA